MYFLGIDTGTRRTKTIVLDVESGEVITQASLPHQNIEGLPDGHHEQDPVEWIRAVESTITTCLSSLSSEQRQKIQGFGVCGQQHSLVVLDEGDRVIRPSKLRSDTSASRQADELNQAFGGAPGLIEMTGNPARSSDTAAKLLWLKQHEPYHFQRIERALLPHDFINYWLTGTSRSEFGDASATGLLDVKTRTWAEPLLDYIDPRLKDILTPASSSREPHGTLRQDLADKWELPDDLSVSAGSGNRMMKAIASGSVTPGSITIELDSAASIYGVNDEALHDPRAEITALCDGNDRWLSLYQINNALSTTRTVQRHYGIQNEHVEAIITGVQPGAEGILMLPYLKNEIAPKLPEASGSWHGISPNNFTPANMMRASFESVALGLTYGLDRMRELGMEPTEARLIGAAADSPLWRQLLADALGIPVSTSSFDNDPARGAAIQAAHQRNLHDLEASGVASLHELTEKLAPANGFTRTEPNSRNHEIYNDLLNRQQYLVETLHGAGFL